MQKVEIIFLPFATNRSPRYLLLSKISVFLLAFSFFCVLCIGAYFVLNQVTSLYHHWQLRNVNCDHALLMKQINMVKLDLKKLDQKIIYEEKFLNDASLVTETKTNAPDFMSPQNFILTRRFSVWEEEGKDWSKQITPTLNDEISSKIPEKELNSIFGVIGYLESEVERNQQHSDQCYNDMKRKYYSWAHSPTILPFEGVITSYYGVLRPHLGGPRKGPHKGVDIAGPLGVPLKACADGKVLFAGWSNGYGNLVIIDHLNGYYSYYGHCLLIKVKENQRVKRYDTVAELGSTGRSTGPHVHFEIRKNDIHQNPMKFIETD